MFAPALPNTPTPRQVVVHWNLRRGTGEKKKKEYQTVVGNMSSLDVEALLEEPFKAAAPSKHHDRPTSSAADGDARNGKDGKRDEKDRAAGADDGRSTPRSHDSRRRRSKSRDSERYDTQLYCSIEIVL